MNFSLVFQNSGDSLSFYTINSQAADVLTYYVENLNDQNLNKFSSSVGTAIENSINELHSTIVDCNKVIYELLDQYIDTYSVDEYLDQRNLNKLHADWVRSHSITYNISEKRKQYRSEQAELIHNMFPDDVPLPGLGSVLSRLPVGKNYDNINLYVHQIEFLFSNIKFAVAEWISIPNPFTKSIITNNICNFGLSFNHLGRTLYSKFACFDQELEFNDENSYNQLLGFVDVKLVQPQTIPLSNEYITWCATHNKIPSGEHLNIGNITDLHKNLTDYRKIIFRNTLQNNAFTIQLHKGT
jgi:uncharacterized protein YqgV (UPF0045/DUF77 family)